MRRLTWPLRSGHTAFAMVQVAAAGLACAGSPSEPEPDPIDTTSDSIELVTEFDPQDLSLGTPPPGSASLNLGVFFHLRNGIENPQYSLDDVRTMVEDLVRSTANVYAPCAIHPQVEVVQVIDLPPHLRSVHGNEQGSWGGHPPPGTSNPALFNYEQNERLTPETRELFGYGKQHASPNAISVFFVEAIAYHTGNESLFVDGLSFSPNLYHHPDDYPLRNSVLVRDPFSMGVETAAYVTAHEIGHMLLNTALHANDVQNLMNTWGNVSTSLSASQCERMNEILVWLYGEEAVPDPGPPTS